MKKFVIIILLLSAGVLTADTNRPDWVDNKPKNSRDIFYFREYAESSNEEEAKKTAKDRLFEEIAKHLIVYVKSKTRESTKGAENDTVTKISASTDIHSEAIIEGISPEIYCEQQKRFLSFLGRPKKFKAWAFAEVSKEVLEKNQSKNEERISEKYIPLLDEKKQSLSSRLEQYDKIYKQLQSNPLHKAMAKHPGGENLFEYCLKRIIVISNDVNIKIEASPLEVQRGDVLEARIKIVFDIQGISGTGSIYCGAVKDKTEISKSKVNNDNTLLLEIPTSGFDIGRHEVELTLMLDAICSEIKKNPTVSVSFTVKPALAKIEYEGEPGDRDKAIAALKTALNKYKVPIEIIEPQSGKDKKNHKFEVKIKKPVTLIGKTEVLQINVSITFEDKNSGKKEFFENEKTYTKNTNLIEETIIKETILDENKVDFYKKLRESM